MRMNSLEVYQKSGEIAGRARKNHDEATARFEINWYLRALQLEEMSYRVEAGDAWQEAYRTAAKVEIRY